MDVWSESKQTFCVSFCWSDARGTGGGRGATAEPERSRGRRKRESGNNNKSNNSHKLEEMVSVFV